MRHPQGLALTAVGSLEERGRAHPAGMKPLPSPFALALHRKETGGGQGCRGVAVPLFFRAWFAPPGRGGPSGGAAGAQTTHEKRLN